MTSKEYDPNAEPLSGDRSAIGFHHFANDAPRTPEDGFGARVADPSPLHATYVHAAPLSVQGRYGQTSDSDDGAHDPYGYGAPRLAGRDPDGGPVSRGRFALLGGGLLVLALSVGVAVVAMERFGAGRRAPEQLLASAPSDRRKALNIQLAQAGPTATAPAPIGPRLDTLRADTANTDVALYNAAADSRRTGPSARFAAGPLYPSPTVPAPRDVQSRSPKSVVMEPPAPQQRQPAVAVASARASDAASVERLSAPPLPARPTMRLPGPLDCRQARTPGEAMICGDPALIAADRHMMRAYAEASAAGASRRVLWNGQIDWLNMREDAARRSKRDVEAVYNDRIDELEDLADAPQP